MAHILLVDDDYHIQQLVSHILQGAGYLVTIASDGKEGLSLFNRSDFDLIVLDVMMPHMDGWEFCTTIRKSSDLPILFLSAKSQVVDKVKGLKMGSDDYLTKPFEAIELLARIKALLRRYGIQNTGVISIGKIILDQCRYHVNFNGKEIDLPLKEFRLLFKLAESPGRTFTREQLLADIWGMDFEGVDRTVDVHINRLRDKFPSALAGFEIQTIRGLGYKVKIIDEKKK
ncbi:response regulator transcription factor [Spirochaeta cellobiosiphila]|uniref:response regulator transcription factor n=1 Tax=Spirochaeta cellobiosiphila TaxID=504483 RepID=UPI00041863B1|nr:response regulator transcription factor [Spirochaeta cellobiosiphila]